MTWDALTLACGVSAATESYVRHARYPLERERARVRLRTPGRVTMLLTDALLAERGYVVPEIPPTISTLAAIRERVEAEARAIGDDGGWGPLSRDGSIRFHRRERLRQIAEHRAACRVQAIHALLGGVDRGLTLERIVRPRLLDLTGYETWTDRAQVADAQRAVGPGPWWDALRELARDDRCWERVGLFAGA